MGRRNGRREKATDSYELGAVARAVGISPRRLEGWIERGVLKPSGRAAGPGSRRRFSWWDVVHCAILAEMQRLFGTDLRPGTVASYVAEWRAGSLESMFIGGPKADGILFFYPSGRGIAFNPQPVTKAEEIVSAETLVLAINVGRIEQKLREELKGAA